MARPGGGGAINPTVEYEGPVNAAPTLSRAYLWGLDLSGTFQGAGGVGGHLAVEFLGSGVYYPLADGNGNITEYVDTSGAVVAHYRYDLLTRPPPPANSGSAHRCAKSVSHPAPGARLGRTLYQSGTLVGNFEFRFSTKRIDPETGCYYYGYRMYNPYIGRWLSRDPIGEEGGVNLYGFAGNDGVNGVDTLGLRSLTLDMHFDSVAARKRMLKKDRKGKSRLDKLIDQAFEKYIKHCQKLGFMCDIKREDIIVKSDNPLFEGPDDGVYDKGELAKHLKGFGKAGDGTVPVIGTNNELSETGRRAGAGIPGLGLGMKVSDAQIAAHEMGHVAGWTGGEEDIDSNGDGRREHSSDRNNLMAEGGDNAVDSKPDKQWCERISALFE